MSKSRIDCIGLKSLDYLLGELLHQNTGPKFAQLYRKQQSEFGQDSNTMYTPFCNGISRTKSEKHFIKKIKISYG